MPRTADLSSSLSRVLQTVGSHAVQVLLGTVTGVLIARTLQPEGRGTYSVIATTTLIAILLGHLSVEKAQIYLWTDRARHGSLLANGLVIGLLSGTTTALIALTLMRVGAMPTTSPLLGLALLTVPFGVAATNLKGIALLRSQVDIINRGTVAAASIQCLPLLVLAATGHITVTSVIVCWTMSVVLPFILLIRALRPRPLLTDGRLACRQLAVGSRYHIGLVAFYLLMTVDTLLINALDSAATVGIYTVAVTTLSLACIPAEAITRVMLPRQAYGDIRQAEQITVRALRLNLLLSAAFIGILAAVSPVLIPLVYGRPFAGSVIPLLALAPGMIALSVIRLVEQHLVRLARPISMTVIAVGALTTNVLLNLVLIPRGGALGAALASSVAYILMALLEVAWFTRSAHLPLRDLLPRLSEARSVLAPLTDSGLIARWRRHDA
ncbi:polysaccharide biosynthesis C-terminal domain-containing protein [Streptosporangium amethystogenes]|uniref:oligosaccharide flippase family protein n=1 Tax=Streptosporangium amethystogenes TaxID=2002 RepID=UPI0037913B70